MHKNVAKSFCVCVFQEVLEAKKTPTDLKKKKDKFKYESTLWKGIN